VKISEFQKVIETICIETWHDCKSPKFRHFPSVFGWGLYGIGKSSAVAQVAAKHEVGFIDKRLAQMDATDFLGIPDLKDGNDYCHWKPPIDIPFVGNDNVPEKGILFLDEFNLATKSTAKGAYEPIQDHSIGGKKLKPGWYIIAAGNEAGQSAFIEELPKPLETRFVHCFCEPDLEGWNSWAINNGIIPEIIAFVNWKSDLFCNVQTKNQQKGAPLPRTWEFASRMSKLNLDLDTKKKLVQGAVGVAAASDYFGYLNVWSKLPDIDEILKGKDIIPEEPNILYAVSTSLISRVKEAKDKAKIISRLVSYALKVGEANHPEFGVFIVKTLFKSLDEKLKNVMHTSPEFAKWVVKYSSAIKDFN